MKRIILITAMVLCAILVISCDEMEKVETNYTGNGHYGKVVIHNDENSGKTITLIRFEDDYTERTSIPPGRKTDEYKLELGLSTYGGVYNSFTITITLDDNTTKSRNIEAYEDIVNHLYYNGTNLVERK